MEALYNLLYRERFWTAYHYIGLIFKHQEEALFKFFCMKERVSLHAIMVYFILTFIREIATEEGSCAYKIFYIGFNVLI